MKSDPVCSQVFQKNSVGDVVKGSSDVGYLYILSTKMQFPDEVIGEDPWWWTPKHTERARIYTEQISGERETTVWLELLLPSMLWNLMQQNLFRNTCPYPGGPVSDGQCAHLGSHTERAR